MFIVEGNVYTIIRLLGKGKSGYSYLVKNSNDQPFVAKMIHHERVDYYTFGDKLNAEITAYHQLASLGISVPTLIAFDHHEEIIIKSYIEGFTMHELIEKKRMDPLFLSKMKDVADYLKQKGFNIDYHPTNFMMKDGYLFYLDYEINLYDPKWDFDHWGLPLWR